MGGMLLVYIVYSVLQTVAGILTLGLASICLTPLWFLLMPLMYVALAWMELAESSIVARDMDVMAALRHSWQLMRENKMSILLMTLLLYLGVGILSSVFVMPVMLPFMALPFSIIAEGEISRMALIISALCLVAYLPIYAVTQGAALAFIRSGWVVGYLQLTRGTGQSAASVSVE